MIAIKDSVTFKHLKTVCQSFMLTANLPSIYFQNMISFQEMVNFTGKSKQFHGSTVKTERGDTIDNKLGSDLYQGVSLNCASKKVKKKTVVVKIRTHVRRDKLIKIKGKQFFSKGGRDKNHKGTQVKLLKKKAGVKEMELVIAMEDTDILFVDIFKESYAGVFDRGSKYCKVKEEAIKMEEEFKGKK